MDEIEVEKLTSIDEVDQYILKHKDALYLKTKKLKDLEETKKELVRSYKEPISLAKDEVNSELELIKSLSQRRLELEADEKLK